MAAGPRCICDEGWKGKNCEIHASDCEDPTCSGNGECSNGKCRCNLGFEGITCERPICPGNCVPPRGVCLDGKCYCNENYAGPGCSMQVFDENGESLLVSGTPTPLVEPPVPEDEQLANLCKERCLHGRCTGEKLQDCSCFHGFNGRFCTMEGCPSNCTGHGTCIAAFVLENSQHFACHCETGWKGNDCSMKRERCSGGEDEDGDTLIDCADPDCCTRALCSKSPACQTVPNPVLELLALPALPPNAPFPERVSFLLQGVQKGLSSSGTEVLDWLDKKRVSVLSGNVLLAKDHSHLVGVKVYQIAVGSFAPPVNMGFTLSREQGGAFDLLVEGGGVVWVRFEHPSETLCPQEIAVNVGWNEFKALDEPVTIKAKVNGSCSGIEKQSTCGSVEILHNHYDIEPSVFTNWQNSLYGATGSMVPYDTLVNPELADPFEKLPIGDTGFSLHWIGNFARTRTANIFIKMLPSDSSKLPNNLLHVKLRVIIEGTVVEQLFEAIPDLSYTFSWNGKNRYNLESAGVVSATVKIGYIYKDCEQEPVWVLRKVQLLSPTCAPVSPPYAGWFLSGQHHFDPQNSILYRSDGSIKMFSEDLYLRGAIGQPGRRRMLTSCGGCASNPECRCEGLLETIRLSRPKFLTTDRAGNLIALDDSAIIRIGSEVKLVHDNLGDKSDALEMVSLAVHPIDDEVYVADKRGRRIYKVNLPSKYSGTVRREMTLVAGSNNGQVCSAPEQQNFCGEGLPAIDAIFISPRSLVFDKFANLFVADGNLIRRISNDSSKIETYIGKMVSDHGSSERIRCWDKPVSRLDADKLIEWPTAIAVNPIDDSLFVADINNVIYQVTSDDQIVVVAGVGPNCPLRKDRPDFAPENTKFRPIRDISFSQNGDLYILQNEPAEVLMISSDRLQVRSLTGQRCRGSCLLAFNKTTQISPADASDLTFSDASSVAVLPNGTVYVADFLDHAIYTLEPKVPQLDRWGNHYDVYDSGLDQIHRFDAVGNHKMTVSASTGATLLAFSYLSEGLQASLNKVTNPATNYELTFTRSFVENSFLWVISSNMGNQQFSARVIDTSTPMDVFIDANNRTTLFSYTPETILLRSITWPDGRTAIFDYDKNTRLIAASSTGATGVVTIDHTITDRGIVTKTTTNEKTSTYTVAGTRSVISENIDQSLSFERTHSSVWSLLYKDEIGNRYTMEVIDSRNSGLGGLDGRNMVINSFLVIMIFYNACFLLLKVSFDGNVSVEWRRTSPPSSDSSTALASVGQLLRQLRVTENPHSDLLRVRTSVWSGTSMSKRDISSNGMSLAAEPIASSVGRTI